MAIEIADLEDAILLVRAMRSEHEVSTSEYLGLSDEAMRTINRLISTQIAERGLPRSRSDYRERSQELIETGMVVGIEIARARAARMSE